MNRRKRLAASILDKVTVDLPSRARTLAVMRHKILSKVQVGRGSGETTGSQFHSVELDLVAETTALTLLQGLPREGPTTRGDKRCFNWTGGVSEQSFLNNLLSFEEVKGFDGSTAAGRQPSRSARGASSFRPMRRGTHSRRYPTRGTSPGTCITLSRCSHARSPRMVTSIPARHCSH